MRVARAIGIGLCSFVLIVVAPIPASADDAGYAALGDSYSAGVGAGKNQHDSCRRSMLAFPVLWQANHPGSLRFVACSGATIADVTKHQLDVLGPRTTLVTVSVGGSDVGFVSVLVACHKGNARHCDSAVSAAEDVVRNVLPGRLAALNAEIKVRAPHATVVVVGYPRLFEPGACASLLSEAKRASLNRGADTLATVLGDRAAAAGFRFLDARMVFAGHGVCGQDAWINDLNLGRLTDSYHPNARGQSLGYLPALTAITG